MNAVEAREPADRLLAVRDIEEILPISRITIWRWVRDNRMPAPITIKRRNYWRQSVIFDWLLKLQSNNDDLTKPILQRAE